MSWKTELLGNLMFESRIPALSPNPNKRIRVKLNIAGVEKRPLENEIEGATKQFIRKSGQFIYGKQNFHKGAFGIIPPELDGYETSADIPSFDIREDCLPEWIYYFFKINNRYIELEKIARGMGSKRIHPEQLADIEIPLPSIDNQRLYISKFKIIENSTDTVFNEQVHQHNLIKKLRQQILQNAVQGKLVPQDPNDEPASMLLERIKMEKEKLVREKKIKKEKTLPPIKPEEIPFEIPESWMWYRVGDICIKVTDGTHHSPTNTETGAFKYVTAKNIKETGIELSNITYISEDVHKQIYARCNPEKGDILYIKDGATTGIVTINNLSEEFSMLSSVALLKLPKIVSNKFLMYSMRSPYYYEATRNDMFGVAITRVTLEKIQNSILALPPLPEQIRIATKIEQLMTLCDELEQSVQQSQKYTQELLQVALKEALEPKN